MIKKDRFPKTLTQARDLACTKENSIAGWRGTGLYPFKQLKILKTLRQRPADFDHLFSDAKPDTSLAIHPPTSGPAQQPKSALEYHPPMPIRLETIEKL